MGQTLDEAIERAVQALGADKDEVEIQVLNEGPPAMVRAFVKGSRPAAPASSRGEDRGFRGDRDRDRGRRGGDRGPRGDRGRDRDRGPRRGGDRPRRDDRRDDRPRRESRDDRPRGHRDEGFEPRREPRRDDREGRGPDRDRDRDRGRGRDRGRDRDRPRGRDEIRDREPVERDETRPAGPVDHEPEHDFEVTPDLDLRGEDERKPEEDAPREAAHEIAETVIKGEGGRAGEIVAEMLDLMGLSAEIDCRQDEEGLHIDISAGEHDGILIGRGGQTLQAFQHLVSRMINRGERREIIRLDVAGYNQRRYEALREEALEVADEVRETGDEIIFDPMDPAERRVIHRAVADETDVRTFTIGDGIYRRVVMAPATEEEAQPAGERGREGR
jgi:spoIIIJ-associated protein